MSKAKIYKNESNAILETFRKKYFLLRIGIQQLDSGTSLRNILGVQIASRPSSKFRGKSSSHRASSFISRTVLR